MKSHLAICAVAVCLASPLAGAQVFSWDPLKDVENALPPGVPNEGKITSAVLGLVGRHQKEPA